MGSSAVLFMRSLLCVARQGKEVLIIGHGSIGRALETRLLPFGANVSGIARTARDGVSSMSGGPQILRIFC